MILSGSENVWAVVLGWNHAEDTIECLRSIQAGEGVKPTLLYTDNGSEPKQVDLILNAVPEAKVLRHPKNVGVSRGFNGGLAHALQQGADYILMANNDTIFGADALQQLLAGAGRHPGAGLLVPKIFYHDHPEVVWSAGSKYRKFPPSIVMRSTPSADDGRYDRRTNLPFSTLCTVLLRSETLREVGLMNPNFLFYYEDYDLCQRIRDGGYEIRLVPESKTLHKVERVTRDSTASPSFWVTYGKSYGIFSRFHRRHWWMSGPFHAGYVMARSLYEGGAESLSNFRKGLREGRKVELMPIATWDGEGVDPVEVVRN